MRILLKPKEICRAVGCTSMGEGVLEIIGQSNKAQAKKIAEWGNEICSEHLPKWKGSVDLMGGVLSKRECPKCWQELLKEIE